MSPSIKKWAFPMQPLGLNGCFHPFCELLCSRFVSSVLRCSSCNDFVPDGEWTFTTSILSPQGKEHPNVCVVRGIQASTLTTTAPNHDPQHQPYGICWSPMPQRSATEQPSSIIPGKQQYAAPSSGYATEQSLPALSVQASWRRLQTASSSSSVWDESRAAPAGGSAMEHQTTGLQHQHQRGDIFKPEDFLQ